MRVLIIHFNTSFTDSFDNGIIEIETNSIEEILEKLHLLKDGSNYTIEIYKNIYDASFFQMAPSSGGILLNFNNEINQTTINQNIYDDIIHSIKLYISEDGSKKLYNWIYKTQKHYEKLERDKFEKWKLTYDSKQKANDHKNILKNTLIVVINLVLIIFTYKTISNYTFFPNNIIITKAIVTGTHNFLTENKNCDKQKIYYDYIINDKVFSGKEYKKCHKTKINKGDTIVIKYHRKKPTYSSINW